MTKRARALRSDPTEVEKRLWRALRGDQLGVRFRRQLVFDQRYILDFYAPATRLAVEVDGGQYSEEVDRPRTAHLVRRGVTVLRFWNNEMLQETEAVVASIADVVEALRAASPLASLPAGGGERFGHLRIAVGEGG